ncbi:DUF2256 domain-containing protein [Synechococcus sp. M16CYN]|uniref:DUF2256 domain-containing protein n=1 Tax=Synechococcus sp. M16CYN TaxID=3103139 RepID=UPI00333F1531
MIQHPPKICPVCKLPFKYRKAWNKCWDKVIYCSERCRRRKNLVKGKNSAKH